MLYVLYLCLTISNASCAIYRDTAFEGYYYGKEACQEQLDAIWKAGDFTAMCLLHSRKDQQ